MEDNTSTTKHKPHARGSEQRQKQERITTRVTRQEFAQFAANAAKAGLTIPSYIRDVCIGERETKSRFQRTVDADASMKLIASMNRIGNNLNQLARQANSGERPIIDDAISRLNETCNSVLDVYRRHG